MVYMALGFDKFKLLMNSCPFSFGADHVLRFWETAYNITERYCWDFRTSALSLPTLNLVDGDKQI